MPTYDYECTKCEHKFERFQSMKDEPIKICPVCRGTVKRLIGSGAGIIFKGAGFYENDYKKKSPPQPASCPASKGNGDCSTCEKNSDNK